MKKISLTLLLLSFISTGHLVAQSKVIFPKEWKQISTQEVMDMGGLSLKGVTIYDPDGKILETKEAVALMTSRKYTSQYYVDKKGKLVAIALLGISDTQLKRMEDFKARQAELAALVGTEAKHFETIDMDGKPVNLADMRGSVVAINFWFIGCKPCIMEMPELNKIVDDFDGKDVKFIAVALDKAAPINSFLSKTDFDYKIIPEGRGVAQDYGIQGYPTHCIIDKEGKIQYFKSGYSPMTAKEVETKISELLRN